MISKPLCKSPEILHRAFSRGELRGIMNTVTNKLKVAVDRSYILKLHLKRSHKVVNAWDMTLNAQFSIRSYIFWVLTDSHFHTDIGTDINQLLQQISCKSQILQLTVCTIHSLVIVKLKEWTACYAIFDKRTETAGGLLHDLFWDSDQVWTRLQKKKQKKTLPLKQDSQDSWDMHAWINGLRKFFHGKTWQRSTPLQLLSYISEEDETAIQAIAFRWDLSTNRFCFPPRRTVQSVRTYSCTCINKDSGTRNYKM
jgi:hypothetical protein